MIIVALPASLCLWPSPPLARRSRNLAAAELGYALFPAQPFQDDADLLFG